MISVQIPKLKAFQKALSQYPKLAEKEIENALKKSLNEIVRQTKPITPVAQPWKWKTPVKGYVGGRLRGSIGEVGGEGIFQLKKLWGAVGTRVKYAVYVHEGTRYMTARPFLQTGVERARGKIQEFLKQGIENIHKAIIRKTG